MPVPFCISVYLYAKSASCIIFNVARTWDFNVCNILVQICTCIVVSSHVRHSIRHINGKISESSL